MTGETINAGSDTKQIVDLASIATKLTQPRTSTNWIIKYEC